MDDMLDYNPQNKLKVLSVFFASKFMARPR